MFELPFQAKLLCRSSLKTLVRHLVTGRAIERTRPSQCPQTWPKQTHRSSSICPRTSHSKLSQRASARQAVAKTDDSPGDGRDLETFPSSFDGPDSIRSHSETKISLRLRRPRLRCRFSLGPQLHQTFYSVLVPFTFRHAFSASSMIFVLHSK